MTCEVFSSSYSANIFETTLSSVSDTDGIQGLARYYQKYEDVEMTKPDTIMVYSRANVFLKDEVDYLFDTLEVVGSKKQIVYVTLYANVKREEKSQTRQIKVGLIEEENGWRLNDATYLVYDEHLENN